jgi:hypothetical protein
MIATSLTADVGRAYLLALTTIWTLDTARRAGDESSLGNRSADSVTTPCRNGRATLSTIPMVTPRPTHRPSIPLETQKEASSPRRYDER